MNHYSVRHASGNRSALGFECGDSVEDKPDTPNLQNDSGFYYFAYGSCMCPVDLRRSLGESTYNYVIGHATLHGYRLGFFRRSRFRNCGVLDVVRDRNASVEGVLYYLPWRLSAPLDLREEGYHHENVTVQHQGQIYANVRTYTVIEKTAGEHAPNDWYSSVVMRGAATCGLPEKYCWKLFHHMSQLQINEQLSRVAG